MPDPETLWNELEQRLTEAPTEIAFRAICSVLDTWRDEDRAQAVAYAEKRLAEWSDGMRAAPWTWCVAMAEGATNPSLDLVRSLELKSSHLQCPDVQTGELPSVPSMRSWCSLRGTPFSSQGDCTADLFDRPERWPGMRRLCEVAIRDLEGFHRYFSSPLTGQLEALQVYLDFGAPHIRPRFDLAGVLMPQRLVNLRELDIHFWHETSMGSLLSQEVLPGLRSLCLRPSWHFDPYPAPPVFHETLRLPVLAQIRALLVDQLPEEAYLTLFSRRDLALESLALVNRPYYGDAAEQEFAYRLAPASIKAIVESGAVRVAKRLRVMHERVGDDILRLVEAVQADTLEELELTDVGLTDEGAVHLANLPQLFWVRSLILRGNKLTTKGVEALARSPFLKNLRLLDLGSEGDNPYYWSSDPQPIGDEGATVLASSDLVGGLHTLRLCNARIGVQGAEALAKARDLSELRVLDLGHNPIGSSGCEALARTSALRSVRELRLCVCGLDDTAIHHLVQADLRDLRLLHLSYNSIAEAGARSLANAATLSSLWVLNLHDNFIGDDGLMALAHSPWLTNLVELDLEQDVWNYRRAQFSKQAANAVAQSDTFRRLDALWAGVVDEYHGERSLDPFQRSGPETDMDLIINSAVLRPEVRFSIKRYMRHYDPSPEARAREGAMQAELERLYARYTPEERDRQRRESDFRSYTDNDDGPDWTISLRRVPY